MLTDKQKLNLEMGKQTQQTKTKQENRKKKRKQTAPLSVHIASVSNPGQ